MLMRWCSGVLVLKTSVSLLCGGGVVTAVADVVIVTSGVLCESCLMASGTLSVVMIGMSGHVLWKHRGCHDEP